MASQIQAVLFNKKYWDIKNCKKWLETHNLSPIKKVHTTENYHRFRLAQPSSFKHFIIKKYSNHIEFVIGFY